MKRRTGRILLIIFALYFTFIGGTFFTSTHFIARIVHQVLLLLLFGGWLLYRSVKRQPFPATPLDGPVLVYFLVYSLATVFALDVRISVEQLWELGTHILLFYLLVDLMRSHGPDTIFRALFLAINVVVIVAVFQLAAWYFGWSFFGRGWFEIGGLQDPLPPVLYRLGIGPFGPPEISGYMAVWFTVGLAWAVASPSKQARRMWVLWLVGVLFTLGLTFSRGGILSLAVSLSVFAFLYLVGSSRWRDRAQGLLSDWRVRMALIILVPLLVTALGVAVVQLGKARQILTGSSFASGDAVRLDLWRSAWQVGLQDPLTGVGPFGFGRALRMARNPMLARDQHHRPHNLPLFVWAEAGLPGVLAFVWLVGMIAWVSYRRWRQAEGPERIRLAGMCAGLSGYAAHNMVDALLYTPNLLPIFAVVAYLIVPLEREDRKPRIYQFLTVVLLVILAAAMLGWTFSHRAYYYAEQARRYAQSGDLVSAVESVDIARRVDPSLGLYAAQRARYLGELAVQDDKYLPDALDAFREAFRYENTYDVLHANYAVLLVRSGDLESALDEMVLAASIYPLNPRYFLWAGEYAERLGDDAQARELYREALEGLPYWAVSAYWDATALRIGVRDEFLRAAGLAGVPLEHLRAVSSICWPRFVDQVNTLDAGQVLSCDGEIALNVELDPEEAVHLLGRALEENPRSAMSYALRAEAQLLLGDVEQAERDALIATFLEGRYGNVILGRIAQANGDFDAAILVYQQSGPTVTVRKGWSFTVYSRQDSFTLLPDLIAPAPDPYYYASWLAMMQVYESVGSPEEAQAVRDAILRYDPYFVLEP